jgi:hypothetical protein
MAQASSSLATNGRVLAQQRAHQQIVISCPALGSAARHEQELPCYRLWASNRAASFIKHLTQCSRYFYNLLGRLSCRALLCDWYANGSKLVTRERGVAANFDGVATPPVHLAETCGTSRARQPLVKSQSSPLLCISSQLGRTQ